MLFSCVAIATKLIEFLFALACSCHMQSLRVFCKDSKIIFVIKFFSCILCAPQPAVQSKCTSMSIYTQSVNPGGGGLLN